jgi:hypothetical protein
MPDSTASPRRGTQRDAAVSRMIDLAERVGSYIPIRP